MPMPKCLSTTSKFCRVLSRGLSSGGRRYRFVRATSRKGHTDRISQSTETQCERLGWSSRWREICSPPRRLDRKITTVFSRSLFLRWLGEITVSFGAEHSAAGNHPYARVQLVTVPQACGQEWSHLIFAGWNEGSWPPPAKGEFAREETITAFNQSVRQFNQHATRWPPRRRTFQCRDGYTLYLGPVQRRQIALSQFETLLGSTTEGVTLAASLVQEDAPERLWNPSECFTQLYLQSATRAAYARGPENFATHDGVASNRCAIKRGCAPNTDRLQRAPRRSTPAGEYDFALRPNDSYRPAPTLSVSDLEAMVSSPAIVWMKRYLGVKAPDDTSNPWAATSGKWVHRWLANFGETRDGKLFTAFPSATKIDERVRVSADERRATLQQLCDSLGRIVPDWWISVG